MPDGRENNGGVRAGAGRKKKTQEEDLISKLKMYDSESIDILLKAMRKGNTKALEIFFSYRWGKPTQKVENEITIPKPTPKTFIDFGENVD